MSPCRNLQSLLGQQRGGEDSLCEAELCAGEGKQLEREGRVFLWRFLLDGIIQSCVTFSWLVGGRKSCGDEMTESKGESDTFRAQIMWGCAGTRDHGGEKEVREVNVAGDPWRQSMTKRRKESTRERQRKNEEERLGWAVLPCTGLGSPGHPGTGEACPGHSCLLLSPGPAFHSPSLIPFPLFPFTEPFSCALLAQMSSSHAWEGAKGILVESLALNLLQQV